MKHTLKIRDEYFDPVIQELKTAELRVNDRNYRVGDTIEFHEVDLRGEKTGFTAHATIKHIADVSFLIPNYVLLSIELIKV